MALTATSLASACTRDDLILNVSSATGFAVGNFVRLDSELVGSVLAINGAFITVRGRGSEGTAAVAHPALALVTTGLNSDLTNLPPMPGQLTSFVPPVSPANPIVTVSVSGAITPPSTDTTVVIDKAGVAAMTLAAPSLAVNGVKLTITSITAFAHTVTATGLFQTGTATVNLATFPAFAGSTLIVMAVQGKWVQIGSTLVVMT